MKNRRENKEKGDTWMTLGNKEKTGKKQTDLR